MTILILVGDKADILGGKCNVLRQDYELEGKMRAISRGSTKSSKGCGVPLYWPSGGKEQVYPETLSCSV